jgi:hypothetical protein
VQNLGLGACVWPSQFPFGIAVFQGKYTVGNISSPGSPLAPAPDFLPGAVYSRPSAAYHGDSISVNLVVQVPIEEGCYNRTGMQIHTG